MPPASLSAAGSLVRGRPSAMLISPSRPKVMAAQPTNCRPPGPLRSGCRRVRQAISRRSSGAAYASVPIRVATPTWIALPTAPGRPNQNSAAMTMALPIRNRPMPSRRSAGSRSRAPEPMARAAEPTTWARPSQRASSPPPTRASRDGRCCRARLREDPAREEPERDEPDFDEREAGARDGAFLAGPRLPLLARAVVPPRGAPERAGVLDLVLLPDDRGGEPAPVEVLALARDRGGEDTRVAMTRSLRHRLIRH